jgi:hypothetical protein
LKQRHLDAIAEAATENINSFCDLENHVPHNYDEERNIFD